MEVAPSKHRLDIQGLRAILMIQVLLYHAWTVGSPVGVDAFILISAYLMTSSFVRRSEAGRMPFFLERWANTFKRLLPPLVVTVIATLGAGFLLLPVTRWKEIITQAFASLTYWENIRLSQVAADYFAQDSALASPFQHLWSMSMQGQMFLLWPVVMTLAVLIAKKLKQPIRKVVFVAFALIAVASLAWLILQGGSTEAIYFDTRARIWEFAFGSAIAAAAPWLRLPKVPAGVLAWLGLGTVLLFSLVSIGTYPGPMAFFPMAATSAILLYAPAQKGRVVERLLSVRPLVALGGISYSVYLVHWPIFVFFLVYVDQERLGRKQGLALIAVSIAVAWVLSKFVDDGLRTLPWANRNTRNKWIMVAASLTIGLIPIGAAKLYLDAVERSEVEAARGDIAADPSDLIPIVGPGSDAHPGARAILGVADAPLTADPIPGPLTVSKTWASWGEPCSDWVLENIPRVQNQLCTGFSQRSADDPHVLVIGNSHAQQLLVPLVKPLLASNGWSGEAILKGACPFGVPEAFDDECAAYNQMVLDYVELDPPDYVFLVVTRTEEDSPSEALVPGVEEAVQRLTAQGITVVGLTDNPRSASNLYECSDERPPDAIYSGCSLDEGEHLGPTDLATHLEEVDGFHLIDMRDAYCIDGICPTIIGNVFVYMDRNHVSTAYAQSMAPYFVERVAERIGLDSGDGK